MFSLGSSLQDAVGPAIVTSVLLLGSAWLWPVLAALVCTGTLFTSAIARHISDGEARTGSLLGHINLD